MISDNAVGLDCLNLSQKTSVTDRDSCTVGNGFCFCNVASIWLQRTPS